MISHNTIKSSFLLIALLGSVGWLSAQPEARDRILRIADVLDQRLHDRDLPPLPVVRYDPALGANARYQSDTIWVGQIQAEFQTDDDWMSILYHEYWHYRHEGEYAVGYDLQGQIINLDTGEMYEYIPSAYRIERSLRYYREQVLPDSLPFAKRERMIEAFREAVSQTQMLPFIYAPSNLSLEEIAAYEAQLAGEEIGLYRLSTASRNAIIERIAQQQDTHQRRLRYERKHQLGPDGLARKDD